MTGTFAHKTVDVAREHLRGVGDRLAAAELDVARGEEQGVAAELVHAHFERDPRARRGFLEDHRQGLPGERGAVFVLVFLHVRGEPEQLQDLVRGVVVHFNEVFVFHIAAYSIARTWSSRSR